MKIWAKIGQTEVSMLSKKSFWWAIWLGVLIVFNFSSAYSAPVLVKFLLENESQTRPLQSLDLIPYLRFDNLFFAEIDQENLKSLDKLRISYQVLDENPWSEGYFLISPPKGVKPLAKVNLADYGEVLAEGDEWKLLKTTNERATDLRKKDYWVTEVRHQSIPLKYSPPLQLNEKALKGLVTIDTSLVHMVSQDSLYSYVKRLQDFNTRFVWSDSVLPAVDWIYNKFKSFGIDSVYKDQFAFFDNSWAHSWCNQYNIVATVVGTVNPDKVIVVGGHYDSIVWNPASSAYTQAPGADDNASGTAATLEQARMIANNPLDCTVIFIAFGAEELGLYGSWAYANKSAQQNKNIQLMMNYDMIGHIQNDRYVNIYLDNASKPYYQILQNMASQYTDLTTYQMSNSSGSDSWPFSQVGYNILYSEEHTFSTHYHSPSDSIAYVKPEYMQKVVRMGLATLLSVSEYPGKVNYVNVIDAGDGQRLFVNWIPISDNDLVSYNVYYGKKSGIYDSVHIVPATVLSDTLFNLQLDSTYYIAVTAKNSWDKESLVKTEVSKSPRVVPLPPKGLVAKPGVRRIILTWKDNKEADLAFYSLYRSITKGSGYALLDSTITDTTYMDTTTQGGLWYYYEVVARDSQGHTSGFSNIDSSKAITLDQGILVIDETSNSLGIPGRPSDAQQDSFYQYVFGDFRTAFYEYSFATDHPGIVQLGPYSSVVWLDDDYDASYVGDLGKQDVLEEYLGYGGNVMLVSWTALQTMAGQLPKNFNSGQFAYDYLHISWADENTSPDFVGANSLDNLYPDVKIDTAKEVPSWGNRLKYITKLLPRSDGESIYSFDSAADDTAWEGKICGVRYLGTNYKTIFLSFPLFYLEKEDAKGLVNKAMEDFSEIPTGIEKDQEEKVPEIITLSQNYPNPFNPSTTLQFRVRSRELREPIPTTLAVYNILGQKVRTLVDEAKVPGEYVVVWDGKDDKGAEVASGVYFYQLKSEGHKLVKKMVLLR
jgi:hypothetical protein